MTSGSLRPLWLGASRAGKMLDVTFRLPQALTTADEAQALNALTYYYGSPHGSAGARRGALFDTWDSTRTRADDTNRFTADDVVAIAFLSRNVQAGAIRVLLRDRADELAGLLAAVGPDRDLVDEVEPLQPGWPAWRLYDELVSISGIKRTTASKLLARKRPRLLPVWDTVAAAVTGAEGGQWESLRLALRAADGALHRRLLRLRDRAGLPPEVSAVRVFDVICWVEGSRPPGS